MSRKPCSVIGCPTTRTGVEALYLFPKMTTQRYQRWLMLFPGCFALRICKQNFICRRHFTADSFDDKQRLKLSADPTVHIDITHAREQILQSFLTKVMYEWSIRCDNTKSDEIVEQAYEAKELLGLDKFNPNESWLSEFLEFRKLNADNKLRYGMETTRKLINIIKELRRLAPSNFRLPADSMPPVDEDVISDIKEEMVVEEIAEDDAEALQAPDTYKEALDMLKPLEVYISQVDNKDAMNRLREIESCIKEAIKSGGK